MVTIEVLPMQAAEPKKSSKSRLKKTPLQVYLEPEQAKALKDLSERTRVAQQVYLREGVDLVLRRYSSGVFKLLAEQMHRAAKRTGKRP